MTGMKMHFMNLWLLIFIITDLVEYSNSLSVLPKACYQVVLEISVTAFSAKEYLFVHILLNMPEIIFFVN